jgi:hypothetical protein
MPNEFAFEWIDEILQKIIEISFIVSIEDENIPMNKKVIFERVFLEIKYVINSKF